MFWQNYWWMILAAILILPLISVTMFGCWMRQRKSIDLEVGAKCWDSFIKLISTFTIIVSGAMMFGKYIDQQETLQTIKSAEALRDLNLREAEFLRQKLNFDTEQYNRARILLGEAKNLAARLASVDKPTDEYVTRFEELYYADLIGVEEPGGVVEHNMVMFRKKLKKHPDAPKTSLYNLSLQLSKAIETELKTSKDDLLIQHRSIAALLARKP